MNAGSTSYSTSSTFGPGVGPVLLSNTHCLGSETSLLHCPHTVFVGTYCTHGRDVGLRCEGKLWCSSIIIYTAFYIRGTYVHHNQVCSLAMACYFVVLCKAERFSTSESVFLF